MKSTSGYSNTPLAKKLGYKPGFSVAILNAPDHYMELLEELPEDLELSKDSKSKKDLIHLFTKEGDQLAVALPKLRNQLKEDGMLWVSWPKKSSGVASDLDGNAIRALGLSHGLVDIKVCAVDDTWSGLKFVIPVRDRGKNTQCG